MSPSASEMIEGMERGESVLRTFGKPGRRLKRKIAPAGFLCRVLFFTIFNPIFLLRARMNPNVWQSRRRVAARNARFFFPFSIKGYEGAPTDRGKIIVINHPTLNDPLCAIIHALESFAGEIIVPVNLPWYESICRYRKKLLGAGIKLVPILTPETAKRLGTENHISNTQTTLVANYTAEFAKTIADGGIAVVAQQATRQRYLFTNPSQAETGDGILSTVTFILLSMRRAKILEKTEVIPIGVIPYDFSAKPNLNPFRKYTLNIEEPILAANLAAEKNAAKYSADLAVLKHLEELLPEEYHCKEKIRKE